MSDRDAIELDQLVFRYAAALDACDVESFLALFTPEARLRSYHPEADEPFADLAGHDQLALIPNAMRNMFRDTVHMMSNHQIELDGDSARGSLLCTARHLSLDPVLPAALTVMIRYVDQYRRYEGAWRIADRADPLPLERTPRGDPQRISRGSCAGLADGQTGADWFQSATSNPSKRGWPR